MNQQDKQDIIDAVTETIVKVVNGKIDRVAAGIVELHERLDQQDIKIEPAIETIETLRSGRKFLIWVLPLFAACGSIVALVKTYF